MTPYIANLVGRDLHLLPSHPLHIIKTKIEVPSPPPAQLHFLLDSTAGPIFQGGSDISLVIKFSTSSNRNCCAHVLLQNMGQGGKQSVDN